MGTYPCYLINVFKLYIYYVIILCNYDYYVIIMCNILTPPLYWGGGGVGVTSAWSPLGNFLEGQAHPNVFAFLQFSSNQGFIFCVMKFLSHVFFVFVSRWFIFIFIYFSYIFSLYSGFFDLCWVISLGCCPRIDRPAHTLYIYRRYILVYCHCLIHQGCNNFMVSLWHPGG